MWKWTNAPNEHRDSHNQLVKAYKDVPEWWYASLLMVMFMFGIICTKAYHTGFPVRGPAFSTILSLVLRVPYGMIYAITNVEVTDNVIAEVIAGYAIPNQPVALIIFKSYGLLVCA